MMNSIDLIISARQHLAEAMSLIDIAGTMKPKTGHWFDVGSLSCRCSNCGCKSTKEHNFCPHCGADMRGREDERTD